MNLDQLIRDSNPAPSGKIPGPESSEARMILSAIADDPSLHDRSPRLQAGRRTHRGLVVAVAASTVAVLLVPLIHHLAAPTKTSASTSGLGTAKQLAVLKASGIGPGAGFGYSVAISGTTAVVGDVGRAFVFTKSGSTWKQVATLNGFGANYRLYGSGDCFGNSVAIAGATIVVGAPCYSDGSGRAYVFTKSAGGWAQVAELKGSDTAPGDYFGFSVDVSRTTIVAGAAFNPNRAGRAYVFTKSAAGWQQTAELTGSDPALAPGYCFAESVAISGATVIVGAPGAGCNAGNAGRAYVFTNSPAGWRQTGELSASDTVAGDAFGFSVAISGRTVLVGAYGHGRTAGRAYVFTKSASGWRQTGELSGSDTVAGEWFGSSVAISGTTAVVGAFSDPPSANQSLTGLGRAYVFTRTAGTWAQVGELRHFAFAYSEGVSGLVAISGTTALIAADGADSSEGRAYVFHV